MNTYHRNEQDEKGDFIVGPAFNIDQRGHIVGAVFGGLAKAFNLFPQLKSQNHNGPWYQREMFTNRWLSAAVNCKRQVTWEVQLV